MTSSFLGTHINDCHKKGDQHRMGLLCRSATDTLGTFISNKSDGTHLTHLSMMKGFENSKKHGESDDHFENISIAGKKIHRQRSD